MELPANVRRVTILTGAALATGLLLHWAGWPQPHRTLEFGGLLIAAILTSLPAMQPSSTTDRPAMRPSFVIEFASLLLVGTIPAMLVAIVGILARRLSDPQRAHGVWRMLLDATTVLVALQAAGLAHRALGGTVGSFVWPWQALPIAAGVVAYCIVWGAAAGVLVPLVTRRPVNGSWPDGVRRDGPMYVIGASLAAGLVDVIVHGTWALLPVAAVPLYVAYRLYRDYVNRLEHDERRREVIESLAEGMCVVDGAGQVTLWNGALERILDCPRERAAGRSLHGAVPTLADTGLPRAIDEVLASRSPRMLPHLGVPSAEGGRMLHVRILPVTDGATLLWQDVTAQARAEQALKRQEERLALVAAGAHDGLWEWDLRNGEFYGTGRWRELIGLPATTGPGTPDEWLDRVHPEDLAPLKQALEAHLSGSTAAFEHAHRIRHEDGTYRSFLCRGVSAGRAGRRPTRMAGSLTDTTDRTITQERLRTAFALDALTGLCNRTVFVERLGRRLEEFRRRPGGARFALLYLDLDRFKVVNDSLGHLVGDELLIAVSRRLESCLRQGDALARLGGDEFAILLDGLHTEQQANVIAFRVQDALSKPLSIGGRDVFTSASIGIAFGGTQYAGPDEIMHDADTAMYHAKARGKARHEVFDADMVARVRDRLGLENDLRHAVSTGAFEVHYQPIVFLASGMCVGFESLVRWTRNGEAVSPATFIPIAEELGLIEPIGTWVLQQACQTFAAWQRRFPDAGLEYITVNVSSRQLMQQNFLSIVEQTVRQAGLKPRDLRIEITETALMVSPKEAAEVLSHLRDFGARIYLDDFGTGYSSLSHLHKLPVDALKIDRSFVQSLLLPNRPAIVESILALARTLDTGVVAEGIETDLQAHEMERLGCTHAQGYLFSRPVSTRAAEAIIVANRPLGPKRAEPSGRVAATGTAPQLVYSSVRAK